MKSLRTSSQITALVALFTIGLMASATASAQRSGMYEITITNLTRGHSARLHS